MATKTELTGWATPEEVEKYTGFKVQTLAHMRSQSRGPVWSKPGGRVRYRWADVEAWFDEHLQNTP